MSKNSQGRAYNRSERPERATMPQNDTKGRKGRILTDSAKIRCSVCNKWFTPTAFGQKICSEQCRADKRRLYDQNRYLKLKSQKGLTASKKTDVNTKEIKLSHKGQLKQVFSSAKEALDSLTQNEIENVEQIMALPYDQRWHGGANRWSEAQRVLARKIELKRIACEAKVLEEEDNIRNRMYQAAQTDREEKSSDDFSDDQPLDNEQI